MSENNNNSDLRKTKYRCLLDEIEVIRKCII